MGLFLGSQVGNSSDLSMIALTNCLGVLTTFIIDPAGSFFLVFTGPILIIAFLAIVYLVISDYGEEELQEYVVCIVINSLSSYAQCYLLSEHMLIAVCFL